MFLFRKKTVPGFPSTPFKGVSLRPAYFRSLKPDRRGLELFDGLHLMPGQALLQDLGAEHGLVLVPHSAQSRHLFKRKGHTNKGTTARKGHLNSVVEPSFANKTSLGTYIQSDYVGYDHGYYLTKCFPGWRRFSAQFCQNFLWNGSRVQHATLGIPPLIETWATSRGISEISFNHPNKSKMDYSQNNPAGNLNETPCSK